MNALLPTDVALALARVVVGVVIAAHGAQKVFGVWDGPGLRGWMQAMTRMNMRPPAVWAYATAFTELAGGIAFALGLLLPIAAALLTMQMAVAVFRAHWQRGFWSTKGGMEFPLSLGLVAAVIGIADPGGYSLDRALGVPAFGFAGYVLALAIAVVAYLAGSRTSPQSASSRNAA